MKKLEISGRQFPLLSFVCLRTMCSGILQNIARYEFIVITDYYKHNAIGENDTRAYALHFTIA